MRVHNAAERGESETAAPGAAGLIARYSGRVPRYTSYPTAAQFLSQPDDAQHRAWLGAIDPALPVSLYHHIPFCDRLCWYCGCHTRVVNTRAPVVSYVKALTREIELTAGALPGRLRASAIHFAAARRICWSQTTWTTFSARCASTSICCPAPRLPPNSIPGG